MFSRRISTAFGEIVSVFMRSPVYRKLTLAGVEQLIVPAVVTGQYSLAQARSRENGFTAPVAAVLWSSVSPEVDQRIAAANEQPPRLAAAEWKSGDIIWIVEAVGEVQILNSMVQKLRAEAWKGREVRMHSRGPDGKLIVSKLAAASTAA